MSVVIPSYAADILGVNGESHSSFGFYIKDLAKDSVIFESEADRALVPASVMKSVTSASALSILGEKFTFKTPVYLTGTIADGVVSGDLVIQASGDPTLDSDNFKNNGGFCDSIVSNLKRLGVRKISGAIVVNQSMPEAGPVDQWEIDDVAWAYGAGIFGFNYKDNIFKYWPATRKSQPVVPDLKVSIENGGSNLERGVYSNHLVVTTQNASDKTYSVTTTMPDPSKVFATELTDKLASANISVGTKSVGASSKTQVYERQSPRLSQILESLMKRSDNMYAEGVLRALASGKSRSSAIDVEKKYWKERGVETDFVTIRDGSGLARVDRLSPRFVGQILEKMIKSKLADRYLACFPVAGVSGTMRSFMADTKLKGRLAFKTGSMNGVQCYAGYVLDANNKPTHIVVIFANSFFCQRATLKQAISKFLVDKFVSQESK
jgi:D-alanyl-D-alanine carboxypeptidase/D-alanyl-D-alanine-endopeptidase (penicillin-binding protein 4)